MTHLFNVKKYILLVLITCVASFAFILLIIPMSYVESDPNNIFFYYFKIFFISINLSITLAFFALLIKKRKDIKPYYDNFIKFIPLMKLKVKREFNAKYQRSMLGILWSMLNPLLSMIVLALVFSYLFRFDIPNYPVYILSGQIIFSLFSEATNASMQSIISSASIIKKIYVPKYIFPITSVISSLVNFVFALFCFIIVALVTRAPLHWTIILIIVPIIYTFLFSLGISMILSCLTVFFRDMVFLFGLFTLTLSYFTPIFYPVSILPKRVLHLMGFNPMYHFVDYFRQVALNGTIPSLWENVVCISFVITTLFFGFFVFIKNQDKYILHI